MTISKKILLACAATALAIPSAAQADGGLTFIIDGDTFNNPFSITNSSTAGETVLGFGISLIAPYGFDTEPGGFGIDPVPFAPVGGTDVITGYTGPGSFADGSNSLAFTFNDFDVGESFIWNIDIDRDSTILTVFGSDLIGSTGFADFSNGLRGVGVFEAVLGNDDAAQFMIQTFTPTPGVPEPGTWAMMILGFGLIGSQMRRRKSKTRLRVSYA